MAIKTLGRAARKLKKVYTSHARPVKGVWGGGGRTLSPPVASTRASRPAPPSAMGAPPRGVYPPPIASRGAKDIPPPSPTRMRPPPKGVYPPPIASMGARGIPPPSPTRMRPPPRGVYPPPVASMAGKTRSGGKGLDGTMPNPNPANRGSGPDPTTLRGKAQMKWGRMTRLQKNATIGGGLLIGGSMMSNDRGG